MSAPVSRFWIMVSVALGTVAGVAFVEVVRALVRGIMYAGSICSLAFLGGCSTETAEQAPPLLLAAVAAHLAVVYAFEDRRGISLVYAFVVAAGIGLFAGAT